jgi:hypothetical protein
MKHNILFFFLLLLLFHVQILAAKSRYTRHLPTFEEFKEKYKKVYPSQEEENYRRGIYDKNKNDITRNTDC